MLRRLIQGAVAGAAAVVLGLNSRPVRVVYPAAHPLSPVAELGRAIFYDQRLSGSGRMSCASCHSPDHAYGPPNDRAVQLGGSTEREQGHRAVPSLRYLDRIPNFSIGPDNAESENANVTRAAAAVSAARAAGSVRAPKVAGSTAGAAAMVPRGGLFWDGRVNTLQQQAFAPLLSPVEMANRRIASVAAKLRGAPYGDRFARLFGARTVSADRRLLDEAMFAVARFQIEDPSFHPYSSKYDLYLQGRATLSADEARGLAAFDDPKRGNCAACHLDRPTADGRPPAFTDYQYEALGVPRNDALRDTRDRRYFDLGLCGPIRGDLRAQTAYCGMFRTPSLRNVATRHVFFHNGVYRTLAEVLAFYDFRDVAPERVYPRRRNGAVDRLNDLPAPYRANVDTVDAPFGRPLGAAPPMSDADMRDIIAFLATLTDGYRPGG